MSFLGRIESSVTGQIKACQNNNLQSVTLQTIEDTECSPGNENRRQSVDDRTRSLSTDVNATNSLPVCSSYWLPKSQTHRKNPRKKRQSVRPEQINRKNIPINWKISAQCQYQCAQSSCWWMAIRRWQSAQSDNSLRLKKMVITLCWQYSSFNQEVGYNKQS